MKTCFKRYDLTPRRCLAPGSGSEGRAGPRAVRVLDTQKDDVAGTALLEAGPHAVDLRDKPVEAETLLELSIIPGRPHGQRPTGPERRVRGSDAGVVVEPVIGRRRERRGTKQRLMFVGSRRRSRSPTNRSIATSTKTTEVFSLRPRIVSAWLCGPRTQTMGRFPPATRCRL